MKRLIQVTAFWCMLCWVSNTLADEDFRVSGVVGQENRWILAIIEDSSGNCSLYAPGDAFAGGKILAITSQGVLVDYSTGARLLRLEGSSFIAAAESSDSSSSPRLVNGSLPPDEMRSAIVTLARESQRDRKKSLDPIVLNALLNLPPTTKITAVQDKPVATTKETVTALSNATALNHPIRVTLGGGSTVYLIFQESIETLTN